MRSESAIRAVLTRRAKRSGGKMDFARCGAWRSMGSRNPQRRQRRYYPKIPSWPGQSRNELRLLQGLLPLSEFPERLAQAAIAREQSADVEGVNQPGGY